MPEGPGISVTLKHRESERYASDGTWVVSHGEPRAVQKYLAETFGLELAPDEVLVQTIVRAERVFRSLDSSKPVPLTPRTAVDPHVVAHVAKPDESGVGEVVPVPTPEQAVENVVKGLDGEILEAIKEAESRVEDDPWASSRGTSEPNAGLGEPKDELLEAIEKAESKTALRNLHSQNVELFKEDKYKDALKARAKEVS